MSLTPTGGGRSVGHLRSTTCGVTLFGLWTIAPSGRASTLQYTYDAMAAEAATHGASRLLDLHSDRCNLYLVPFLLHCFSVTLTANMIE